MIHDSAIVSTKARLGQKVSIGPFSIVHDNVEIGDGTIIGSHCELGIPSSLGDGSPLVIGANGLIRSHSIFYESSSFGKRLVTGHRVTVREMTRAGENLQIGTLGDIQGHCSIGHHVRFHSNVHIGQKSTIGDCVWIFPYVVLTNDPHPPSEVLLGVTIEDFVAIATMSIVLPGVTIGRGALVGAHSSVSRDVEPDTIVSGSPAKFMGATSKIILKDGSNESAYPWRRHFHRGYPDDLVDSWIEEFRHQD
ncbi:N-acetyltransferase [Aquabacterium sp.]|uniref:acyltransferase n=1 Tax=Aquabacterium sp. TaxID=1872578 RepID=UPI003D6CAACD